MAQLSSEKSLLHVKHIRKS